MLFQGRLCALVGPASRLSAVTLRRAASEIRPSALVGLRANARAPPAMALIQLRNLHSVKFSRSLEFFSSSSDLPLPKHTFQLGPAYAEQGRPMTLLFCWLMSKEKHIRKYAELYNNLGFDVLKVRITPYDLLRPTKGTQVENDFKKHSPILNRMVGQIWDSAVDLEGIPFGTSRAVTNNVTIQKSIQKYLEWYLKVRYNTATIHYERASIKMHQNYAGAPGLFFISRNDPVSTPEMVSNVYSKWEANGHEVFVKCWDKSRHVSHYRLYQKEYEDHVIAFLERIRLLEPARHRASM